MLQKNSAPYRITAQQRLRSSLQKPDHGSYRALAGGIAKMAFDSLVLLLPGQRIENMSQMTPRLPGITLGRRLGANTTLYLQAH